MVKANNLGVSRSPILVKDFYAIFGGDVSHVILSFVLLKTNHQPLERMGRFLLVTGELAPRGSYPEGGGGQGRQKDFIAVRDFPAKPEFLKLPLFSVGFSRG